MENFLNRLSGNHGVGIGLSVLGGFLSFFTPCVLPLVPVYFTFLTGKSLETLGEERWSLLREIFFFALGFTCIFVILGASATAAGAFLFRNIRVFKIAGGVFIIFLAVNFLGLVRNRFFQQGLHVNIRKRVPFVGSFIFGMVFGFSWTPCTGVILGAILTFAAFAETVKKGITLLLFYSLGLAVPFFILGIFFSRFRKWQVLLGRHYKKIQYATGVLLLVFGYFLLM